MVYAEWDFSSFEKHFLREVMEVIEFELYRYMLPICSEDDLKFLLNVLGGKNHLHFRLGRAVIAARRLSGEVFTSLGNGFTNLMLVLYLAHLKGLQADGVVEGDDGLFALSGRLEPADWAMLGFTVKEIHYYDDPGKAHFCGMIFAESGEIIRDPIRFFQKFGWTHSKVQGGVKVMLALARAKALSTVYETPQCPLIGAAARRILKETRGIEPDFVPDGYHDAELIPRDEGKLPDFAPSIDTRVLFEEKFGVSIESQLFAEGEIAKGNFSVLCHVLNPSVEVEMANIKYLGDFVGP